MGFGKDSKSLVYAAVFVAVLIIGVSVYIASRGGDSGPVDQEGILGKAEKKIEVDLGSLPPLGSPGAPITIIEFSDFQCPFCGAFAKGVLPQLKANYIDTGKVRLAWRDFAFLDEVPGVLGQESHLAAEAARCAADQGKFWEYHDHIFRNQQGENEGTFSLDNLKLFAREVGLDETEFNACLDSRKHAPEVIQDTIFAREIGVGVTPSIFVGVKGKIYSDPEFIDANLEADNRIILLDGALYVAGSYDYAFFNNLIQKILKEVKL